MKPYFKVLFIITVNNVHQNVDNVFLYKLKETVYLW